MGFGSVSASTASTVGLLKVKVIHSPGLLFDQLTKNTKTTVFATVFSIVFLVIIIIPLLNPDLKSMCRKTYEASLVAAGSGSRSQPCIVTEYPVLGNRSGIILYL